MACPVLILGDSGTGKTSSLRKLDPLETLVIQSTPKPLPFRSLDWKKADKQNPDGSIIQTDNYGRIHRILDYAPQRGKNIIVIDDSNYIMQFEEMRRVEQTGFSKFTQMAKNFYELIEHAQSLPTDTRIYFMMHTQTDANGVIKPKTTGKMLDEKIVIEGLFAIVLRSMAVDGRYMFSTRTSGSDPVKTPLDMFENHEIDNDLRFVDDEIKKYYGLTN